MKITSNLIQALIEPGRPEIKTLLDQLQPGQRLQAKVLAQVQPGVLRLLIANTALLARSEIAGRPGSLLQLEVVRTHPSTELRLLREPDSLQRHQQLIRGALLRQSPPAEARQIGAQMQEQAQQTPRLASALRSLISLQQGAGVRLTHLDATQLQRAVTQSGIFHEARLLQGSPAGTPDLKARLLQLLDQLRAPADSGSRQPGGILAEALRNFMPQRAAPAAPPTPAPAVPGGGDSLLNQLIRLVEGSIARIQLQQAAALPAEDNPTQRQVWQMDIPIHLPEGSDDVMLRIERDGSGDTEGDGSAAWAVNLAFQFDSIGTLQSRIAINGDKVAITFWSERHSTHERLQSRLPTLQRAFEAQGLEVVHLAGLQGAPREPLISVPVPANLFDERA